MLLTKGASANYTLLLNPKPKPKWHSGEPPPPSGQRYISRGVRRRAIHDLAYQRAHRLNNSASDNDHFTHIRLRV